MGLSNVLLSEPRKWTLNEPVWHKSSRVDGKNDVFDAWNVITVWGEIIELWVTFFSFAEVIYSE